MPNDNPNPTIPAMPETQTTTDNPEQELPPEAATAGDNQNPRRRGQRSEMPEVGYIVQPEQTDDLDLLVLYPETKADILSGLRSIELRSQMEQVWNISRIQPQNGRCILNFYGDPGTGKTRVARAIALRLGKPMYQVEYAAIISKYLGDTAKHINIAFAQAEAHNAILFFDEADSLLSRRVDMNESCATSINQNRNVLMQCLDRFNGVVIMTTNLFGNYDAALLRRIARHIEFKLPNRSMRKVLFEKHLPNRSRVEADLLEVAKSAKGLSGGDILNVCVNSIYAGSVDDDPQNWKVTQFILATEIEKVIEAKRQHKTRKTDRKEIVGFNPTTADSNDLEQ